MLDDVDVGSTGSGAEQEVPRGSDPLNHVHDVIMMELPGDTEGEVLDDVVYQYSRAPWVANSNADGLLHRVRGALLTLSGQLDEIITGDKPVQATLVSDGQVVHILFRYVSICSTSSTCSRC